MKQAQARSEPAKLAILGGKQASYYTAIYDAQQAARYAELLTQ